MRIENAIRKIHAVPGGWVRIDEIEWVRSGLDVSLGVHGSKRGRKVQRWRIECRGVRGYTVTELDGGGLCLLPATHPAARQYIAPRAVLRWSSDNYAASLEAIYRAHVDEAGDWIEPDIYETAAIVGGKHVCRGPDFPMRAYAKALRGAGVNPKLKLGMRRTAKGLRPKAFVIGCSYVVADLFAACQIA